MLKGKNSLFYTAIINTTQRFSLPLLFSALLCLLSLTTIDTQRNFLLPDMILAKSNTYLSIFLCSFLLFIGLKLIVESHKYTLKCYYSIGALLFFALAQHLYTSDTLFYSASYITAGLFLSLFIAPFLKKSDSDLKLWSFCYHFLLHLRIAFLAALTLLIASYIILFTIEFLFEVEFYKLIHKDLAVIIVTFILPFLIMTGIPKRFDTNKINYPKIVNIIFLYLINPLLFIYTLILWIYIAKIAITRTLPKGILAYLSSTLGYLGVITYLVSYPIHNQPNIMSFFGKYFFKLLPIPLLGLAISIGVRVQDYGITESRYLLLLSLTWLLSSTGFILLRPKYQVLKFLIGSLSLLLLAASFGPWSAANVSARSQIHRLVSLLEKNKILIAGEIHQSKQFVSLNDSENIVSIINYLIKTNKIKLIKSWFLHCEKAHLQQETKNYQLKAILKDLGIEQPKTDKVE